MPSRRDQIEAQRFMADRVTCALTRSEPDAMEPVTRRDSRAALLGIAVAGLVAAVVAGIALFLPSSSTQLDQPSTLILDKDTGGRFVVQSGRLRPVLNVASARLLLGAQMKVETVSDSALAGVSHGSPIGTAGLPDTLPDATEQATGPWWGCTALDSMTGNPVADGHLVLDVGVPRATVTDSAVLVAFHGQDYLVANGLRHRITVPWALDALGATTTRAFPVSGEWLSLLPAGQDMAPLDISGAGAQGPFIDGVQSRVGDLLMAGQTAFVVTRGGVRALTPLELALISGDPHEGQARPVRLASLAAIPRQQDDSDLPTSVPHLTEVGAGQSVCVQSPTATSPLGIVITTPLPGTPTGGDIDAHVAPDAWALVAARQPAPDSVTGVQLVMDDNTAYPIGDAQALQSLGIGDRAVTVLPQGFLTLVRSGPVIRSPAQ